MKLFLGRAVRILMFGTMLVGTASAARSLASESATAGPPPAPRTVFSRLHLADYDAELRGPNGRVDADALANRLKDLGVTTYYWLIWHASTDWDDLKFFLPRAAGAGIEVWAYLVPPSEPPPSQPFGLDFERWAQEIAKLSLLHTNLTAWVIDDFYANHERLTPAYLKRLQARAKSLNPRLALLPLMYFSEMRPKFVADYRAVIDGVVVAYLQDREEIERTWALLNDAPIAAAIELVFPWNTSSREGDFVVARVPAKVLPGQKCTIRFRERESFTGPTAGYHFKQVLIGDTVVWEEDVAGGSADWREVSIDATAAVDGKTNVTLGFRLLDKKGVSNFGVEWRLAGLNTDRLKVRSGLESPEQWQADRRGAFETGFGRPPTPGASRFHIPFISMTAANAAEFRLRHGEPASPERIGAQLRLSLEAWKEGKCDGVVTYCLDKTAGSASFPLVERLFHEFTTR